MSRNVYASYALPLCFVLAGSFFLTQGGEKKKEAPPAAAGGMQMPTPGPEHKMLLKDVGVWDATQKMFMPGAPPTEQKGVSTISALGEFWQMDDFKGEFMGQPFSGRGGCSYDSAKKKFVGFWIDSMTPELCTMEGSYDAATKTLTMTGTGPDMEHPGQRVPFRATNQHKDDDTRLFTMNETRGGKESVVMTIEYKRRK